MRTSDDRDRLRESEETYAKAVQARRELERQVARLRRATELYQERLRALSEGRE